MQYKFTLGNIQHMTQNTILPPLSSLTMHPSNYLKHIFVKFIFVSGGQKPIYLDPSLLNIVEQFNQT